jgi:hypothetical protein
MMMSGIHRWSLRAAIFALVAFSGGFAELKAAPPPLGARIYVQNGTDKLNVGSWAAPNVADWNGDGYRDLVVGDYSGYFRVFRNQGSAEQPEFNTWSYAQDFQGTPLKVPGG